MGRASSLYAVLVLAAVGLPARAGDAPPIDIDQWRAIHRAIYELENRIAFLEADPQTDDGYKAPIINKARAEILRLRAALGRAQWRWTTPCCYSRPPIQIR